MFEQLDTDYLVIGAGASGMAFADEVVSRCKRARIIMVDRRAAPGGHWNNAYQFVTLHQPALYYGVNSERLERFREDLASGEDIVAYYARVLDKLCATGRVQFFGQCEYQGEGRFESQVGDGRTYQVIVQRRVVDATDYGVTVPSMRPPEYGVAEGIHCVPINALAAIDEDWSRYVVVGAGKTGIDAVLRLLDMGTEPDRITWIVSNDAWLINRDMMVPEMTAKSMQGQLRETCLSTGVEDYFRRFEAHGWFLRVDPSVPTAAFRCATVNLQELEALRRVRDVVRMGRVRSIEAAEIVLDRGSIPTSSEILHVDCTANGLAHRPSRPVFDGPRIVLQPVNFCQPAMSAALIGYIETEKMTDDRRNRLTKPCPHPTVPLDYFVTVKAMADNMVAWPLGVVWWMLRQRLSLLAHLSIWSKLHLLFSLMRWFAASRIKADEFIRELEGCEQDA